MTVLFPGVHLFYLVAGDVWLATVERAECEAALLQLGLGVVPLLGQDELLKPREEANLNNDFNVKPSVRGWHFCL